MKHIFAIGGIAFALCGCTFTPTTEDVSEFGKSAAAISTTYTSAMSLDAELARAANTEVAACAYLNGQRFDFPASKRFAPDAQLIEEARFLKAVADYATALSEATDEAGVKKLEDAANGFAGEAAGLTGVVASVGKANPPSGLPVVKPIFDIVALIGFNVAEQRYRARIRKIVEDVEPILVLGSSKLTQDQAANKAALTARYETWREAKVCVLKAQRRPRASAGNLYADYVAADTSARDFLGRIAVLDKIGAALASLITTHAALLDAKPSELKAKLAAIKRIATDLKTIIATE